MKIKHTFTLFCLPFTLALFLVSCGTSGDGNGAESGDGNGGEPGDGNGGEPGDGNGDELASTQAELTELTTKISNLGYETIDKLIESYNKLTADLALANDQLSESTGNNGDELASTQAELTEITTKISNLGYETIDELIESYNKLTADLELANDQLSGNTGNNIYALGKAYKEANKLCTSFDIFRDDAKYEYYFASVVFYKLEGTTYIHNPISRMRSGNEAEWKISNHWADGEYPIIGLPNLSGTTVSGFPMMFVRVGPLMENNGTEEREFSIFTISKKPEDVEDLPLQSSPYKHVHTTSTLQRINSSEPGDFKYGGNQGQWNFILHQGQDVEVSATEKLNTFISGELATGSTDIMVPCFKVPSQNDKGT